MTQACRPKPNRKRNIQLSLWASEEEAAQIRERMGRVGVTGLSAYLRKVAMDGFFVHLDLTDVRELVSLLRYCSNNLNQYAKKAHETGSVHAADVEDLRKRLEEIWEAANGILRELARIQ